MINRTKELWKSMRNSDSNFFIFITTAYHYSVSLETLHNSKERWLDNYYNGKKIISREFSET